MIIDGEGAEEYYINNLTKLKNINHICQNVPVTTAQDMADHVLKFVDGRLDNQLIETKYLVQDNKSKTLDYEKESVQLDAFMV